MSKHKFLDFDELVTIFADIVKTHDHVSHDWMVHVPPTILSLKLKYYEWDIRTKRWNKLNIKDPEPPTDLPYGEFDGQLIQVFPDDA